MADGYAANSLTPHDIVISDRTVFLPGGAVTTVKSVTYFVGSHGPFTDEYAVKDATPDAIKQGINNQVRTLREVVSADYPTA